MKALIGTAIAFSIFLTFLICLNLILKPVKADSPRQTTSPTGWGMEDFQEQTTTFVAHYPGRGALGEGSLALGDINGDGYDDLLIGDRLATVETQAEGEVYLYLGPFTFGQTITVPDRATIVFQGSGSYQPQLGVHVSTGDLNGDGYDDVIMGGGTDSFVYLGSSHITSTSPISLNVTLDEVEVAITILNSGRGPAICDLNGDNYDDLFVQTREMVWGMLGNSQLSMTTPITRRMVGDQSKRRAWGRLTEGTSIGWLFWTAIETCPGG